MNYYKAFIVFSISMIVLLIVLIVVEANRPPIPNDVFENTSRDSLSEIKQTIKEYVDVLEDVTFYQGYSVNSTEYNLEPVFYPDDITREKRNNDRQDIELSYFPGGTILHVLKSVSGSLLGCVGCQEGERCKFLLGKKWVELSMEGDQVYINYYAHHKSNFLYPRDEWSNYEIYLNKVDGKVEMIVGDNNYDVYTGYWSELTYYYLEDTYLEVYNGEIGSNLELEHMNYETSEYFHFVDSFEKMEISHYNPETNVLVTYDLLDQDAFIYQLFEEEHNVFFYNASTHFMRYDLSSVSGWSSIKQVNNDWYDVYQGNTFVDSDIGVFISTIGQLRASLFLQPEGPFTENMVNLSYYGLSYDISLQDIMDTKAYYDDHYEEIMARFNIALQRNENYAYFNSRKFNHDDSDIIQ